MNARAWWRLALGVLLVQALAQGLWPSIARQWTRSFCAALDATPCARAAPMLLVHRSAEDPAAGGSDTWFGVLDPRTGARFAVPYGAAAGGFFPLTLLVGLALFTPGPWRVRWHSFLPALVFTVLALRLRAALVEWKLLTSPGPFERWDLPPVVDRALHLAVASYGYSSVGPLVMVGVVWAVAVRGAMGKEGDWRARLDSNQRPSD